MKHAGLGLSETLGVKSWQVRDSIRWLDETQEM
jgi:hypothetical protein